MKEAQKSAVAPLQSKQEAATTASEQREHVSGEKERVARLSRIRQFVFGSLDGLLVPLGVVSGVAGGTGSIKAVIVAGLAEAFAGALSMGAGEFLSGRAEAQVQKAEVEAEREQLRCDPETEFKEMIVHTRERRREAGRCSGDRPTAAQKP